MIVVRNKIIPSAGLKALTAWPLLFVRAKRMSEEDMRHEEIHGEQQKEMLVLLFYPWYLTEWLVKWVYYRNSMTAYKNISFEREAYENQSNSSYLDTRKRYSWIKYIKQ